MNISSTLLSSLLPYNYNLAQYYCRPFSAHVGCIAIIKNNSIYHIRILIEAFSFFECIGSVITSSNSSLKGFYLLSTFVIHFYFFIKFEFLLECHFPSNINLFFLVISIAKLSVIPTIVILTNYYIISIYLRIFSFSLMILVTFLI